MDLRRIRNVLSRAAAILVTAILCANIANADVITGVSKPDGSNDGASRPVADSVYSVSVPPYPLNISSGISYLINPTIDNQFVLHDHGYISTFVPDPARSVVTYTFDEPTVVDQIEVIQHVNGITEIEAFVGNSLGSLVSIGVATVANPTVELEASIFDFNNIVAGSIFQFVITRTVSGGGFAAYRAFPRDENDVRFEPAPVPPCVDPTLNSDSILRIDFGGIGIDGIDRQCGFTAQGLDDVTYDLGGGLTVNVPASPAASDLSDRGLISVLPVTGSVVIPDGTDIRPLLDDFIFRHQGTPLSITISGATGTFTFEAWFWDPVAAGTASAIMFVDVSIDGGTTFGAPLVAQSVYIPDMTTTPVSASFTANGIDDVVIRVRPGSTPPPPPGTVEFNQFRLNGFALIAGAVPPTILDDDYDRDRRSDIQWRNTVTGQSWLYGMIGKTIDSSTEINTVPTVWQIVGNGDYDGDGDADILWRNSSTGQNWMYLMNGALIDSSVGVNTASTNWQVVGNGDYNGDRKSDILWRNSVTGQNWMYLMNGALIDSSVVVNTVPTAWQVVGNGDYGGDGKSDILWRNSVTGQNWMYFMNGAAVTSSVGVNTVPTVWQVAGNGDYDGDGDADILWRNSSTGQNWMYFMHGATITSSLDVNTVSDTFWGVVGDGDYDGDTKADILWRNSSTGQNWMYLMNGAVIMDSVLVNTVSNTDWEVVNTN